jgi:uncharacterized protein YutE (UPF0331/DUF86 family)
MRPDLYQAETARVAAQQGVLLREAKDIVAQGRALSPLEQGGVLHALQVLIENAIGKAKQTLKARGQPVPVSVYDAFAALTSAELLPAQDLAAWNAIVGLRNRIVHDYMNIDFSQIAAVLAADKDLFVIEFLLEPPQKPRRMAMR